MQKVKNIHIYNNRKQNEIQKKFETKQTKTNYKQKKNQIEIPGFVQNSPFPRMGLSKSPFGLRMPTDIWSLLSKSFPYASIR